MAGSRRLHGVDLVAMEAHLVAEWVRGGLADSEDAAACLVQQPVVHQLVHQAAGFEGRVETDAWLGPQLPVTQTCLDALANAVVPQGHEAGDVRLVVGDQLLTKLKDIHWNSDRSGGGS
ncbi:MAG: hypothetical protein KDB16_15805, partial [Acidimicrobiales bacterium]|nr:hypothetical protein [Acidimicrobiales bacterium]